MNGRLITTRSAGSGSKVASDTSIETPVTPPSMKWLESRNPFRPMHSEKTPATM